MKPTGLWKAVIPAIAVAAAAESRCLKPLRFKPLPLGTVRPEGWLKAEMRTTAAGLAGHQYAFYRYVNDSRWLYPAGSGGQDYSDLNEALPYWFNGLVPLAYTLSDARLKDQVHKVARIVLDLQTTDGWIGPEVPDQRNFWARTPLFLGLIQLAEANTTWVKPVLKGLRKFMDLTHSMLENNSQGFTNCPKSDCSWGQMRIHDFIITIQWMLERHPRRSEDKLWEIMDMFYTQNNYNWDRWYSKDTYPKVIDPNDDSIIPYIHGVNIGQGLKAPAVIYRFTGNRSLIRSSMNAVDWTFRYHGSASGTILADELARGLAPYMGSELCTAVETSYSLAYLYQALGHNKLADRTERTIFNAFPAMLTGDKWAHQYMAQPNQPWGPNDTKTTKTVFTTAKSGVATMFGLEPQYPCCTVNYPQGYPKFVSNSWVSYGANGLAHALLGPSSATVKMAGGRVSIRCDTDYPFADTLVYTVKADRAFDFYIRVPTWYEPQFSAVRVGDSFSRLTPRAKTGMHRIPLEAGETTITYKIGTSLRTEKRPNNTVAVYHGNVLYALEVGFENKSSNPHYFDNPKGPGLDNQPFPQLRDDAVNHTGAWAVAIDPSTFQYHRKSDSKPLPEPIFEHGAPPTFVTVVGCEIEWNLYHGITPDWAPANRACKSQPRRFKLIPYGAAKVHMSDLPVVKLKTHKTPCLLASKTRFRHQFDRQPRGCLEEDELQGFVGDSGRPAE